MKLGENKIPKRRYLTLEEVLQRLFEEDLHDEQSDKKVDLVVAPSEAAKDTDDEKGNDNILN